MSIGILVFGAPGAGKTSAARTLDPATTVILDADVKNGLPWQGWRKQYSKDKGNYFTLSPYTKKGGLDSKGVLDRIISAIETYGTKDEYKNVRTLIVDGFNNAMLDETVNYKKRTNSNNKFEIYESLRDKVYSILMSAKTTRDNLFVVFNAHVAVADPYSANDYDHMFSPGKAVEKYVQPEGQFLYVFYAKSKRDEDGKVQRWFETVADKSTARAPDGCFDEGIPNDLQFIINRITEFEGVE